MPDKIRGIKTAWHEAGHAVWAIDNNRDVSMHHGGTAERQQALGFCDVKPEPILPSEEGVDFLLSGMAAEKVCCELHGLPFKDDQIEWFEALDCSWGHRAISGQFVNYRSPYEFVVDDCFESEKYLNAVPKKDRDIVVDRFNVLVEKYRNDSRLQLLATEYIKGKDLSSDSVKEIVRRG